MVKIRKFKKGRGIPSLKKPDVGLCKNCQIGKMGRLVLKTKTINIKMSWRFCINVDQLV